MRFFTSKYVRGVVVLAVLLGVGWSLDWPLLNSIQSSRCRDTYSFVNTDVICGQPDAIVKTGYIETQSHLVEYLELQKEHGTITEASVYFRDLVHGPTFGINELADFAPASLLKLPLAIVFLSSAEAQSELLKQELLYVATTSDVQRIKPRESAEQNRSYTILELIEMMLRYSDNASYLALDALLSESEHRAALRERVFQEIGLIDPKSRIDETITVRGYASIFRILFNVSYLNVEYSELLLGLLSKSEYAAGIKAGLPQEIVFAGKFGERVINETGEKQLHDCGIIYFPENPYLLCIMTRGNDWAKLEETIAEISRIVFEEVDSRQI